MRKRFVTGLIPFSLLFIFSSAARSQTASATPKPDFSGTWLFDAKKSNSSPLTTRSDLPITISHQDAEFRVTIQSESNGQLVKKDFVYFTNGSGETNEATSMLTTNPSGTKPEDLKNRVTKSKTKWSGKKIVTSSRLRLDVAGHFVEFEQVDEWKMSDDGKVLTQTSQVNFLHSDSAFMPAQKADKKRVYNRQ